MNKLVILLLIIVFLAGCINQINEIPTQPEENETQPENIPSQENVESPQPPSVNVTTPSKPVPKTYNVSIRNFVFSPTILTINVSDSVRWTNFDVVSHSATSDNNVFDTGLLNKGESKTMTFDEAGNFAYHCASHSWMFGKVIVK